MLSIVLCFVAFLLLLLVSLSVPIAKHIFLFRLSSEITILRATATGTATFGVWGYCVSPIDVNIIHLFPRHLLSLHQSTPSTCSNPHLGFHFDSRLASALHVSGEEDTINATLTTVLVLHPIACVFAFLAFILSIFMSRRSPDGSSRGPFALASGVGVSAAVLSTVVFLIDIGLVAVVRHKLNNTGGAHLTLSWGNAVWMSLGATIALWAAAGITLRDFLIYRGKARNEITDRSTT